MRDSIGGAWLFGLMVTFVLLFTAFIAVTINYTKAFRVKNEILDFIEREEGLTNRTSPDDGAIQLIVNYLDRAAHTATGECPKDYMGIRKSGDSIITEKAISGTEYLFCVKKVDSFDKNEKQRAYYKVSLFFKFDLPVLQEVFTYGVHGSTTQIQYPADCQVWINKC